LVISKDLAGPVGLFVKFSVLQDYGVDRVFLLENGNLDSSQRNVVFLVHAEKVHQVALVAGKSPFLLLYGTSVDFADFHQLLVINLVPRLKYFAIIIHLNNN
jgi:hypothetical protein